MNISNYLDGIAKPLQGLAPWILRLVLGTSFILHGLGKFPLPPEKMVTWFESMGIAAPEIVASLVAMGEVAAGAAVILGGFLGATGHLLTRLGGGA
ncbi:MAG: DoxX family protein, partial [SAR86 cluster bacterium BACL1 MAG-120820-bin45]